MIEGAIDRKDFVGELFFGAGGSEEAVVDPDDVFDVVDPIGKRDGGVFDDFEGEVFDFAAGGDSHEMVGFVVLFAQGDVELARGRVDREVDDFDIRGRDAEPAGDLGAEAFGFAESTVDFGGVTGLDGDDPASVTDEQHAFVGEADDVDGPNVGCAGL